MAEFIDEKSAKAKGKRVTTLEVASIEDITPEPVIEEPEEEEGIEEPETDTEETTEETEVSESSDQSIEVEGVKMTFEKPADTQLDLF